MKEELLRLFNSSTEEFYAFFCKATSLRFSHFKDKLETCGILNAKSGKCPSDCKFCTQSRHFKVEVKEYPLMSKGELVKVALEAFSKGINRFSFVTSGVSPTPKELQEIGAAVEELKSKDPSVKVCASLGQLTEEQLRFLKSCGLDRYHHNLETSREFYPKVATLQRWEDRYATVAKAKEVGLSTCCGGIFGLGEGVEDIYSLALSLKELEVDSVPVNFLHPIKGTPLEKANYLTPLKSLKVLVALRLLLPDKEIRVCGGREYNLQELQPLALLVADSLMVGNYLTTKGRNLKDDELLIKNLGLKSTLRV